MNIQQKNACITFSGATFTFFTIGVAGGAGALSALVGRDILGSDCSKTEVAKAFAAAYAAYLSIIFLPLFAISQTARFRNSRLRGVMFGAPAIAAETDSENESESEDEEAHAAIPRVVAPAANNPADHLLADDDPARNDCCSKVLRSAGVSFLVVLIFGVIAGMQAVIVSSAPFADLAPTISQDELSNLGGAAIPLSALLDLLVFSMFCAGLWFIESKRVFVAPAPQLRH